ncbi:MAG TPA: SDR family oxidoreductase [Gammaproteobacteria bacterium]|nr:SDR family oxidoreductase [Gammaproteobacteria bacterium]
MTGPSTSKPIALITGASSGIGLELSRLFAAGGYALALSARRTAELNQLADELKTAHGTPVTVFPLDLSQPGAARELWTQVEKANLQIDVLVNNAGLGITDAFVATDPAALETMLRVNMEALTMLTRYALPAMLQRRRGRILNVGSVVGYQPGGPGMAVYYASKSYVLSFSRALTVELRGSGVTVTALCPGTTRTEFEQRAGEKAGRLFRLMRPMDARTVAMAGYQGLHAGRAIVIPGLFNKIMAVAGELPPRQIALAVNRILLS